MKRNLFLLFVLGMFVCSSAIAEVTVTESTDTEYIINSGYSQAVAEDIFMQKNRVLGKPIEPLYEKPQSKYVQGWFKFWSYLDPARETEDKIHHDVKITPSYTDL